MALLLSFKWNSIRLGGPAHGIVTKTIHKTLPGGGGGTVVGVKGWWGQGGGGGLGDGWRSRVVGGLRGVWGQGA